MWHMQISVDRFLPCKSSTSTVHPNTNSMSRSSKCERNWSATCVDLFLTLNKNKGTKHLYLQGRVPKVSTCFQTYMFGELPLYMQCRWPTTPTPLHPVKLCLLLARSTKHILHGELTHKGNIFYSITLCLSTTKSKSSSHNMTYYCS